MCVLLFLICVSCLGVSHVRSSDDPGDRVCEDPPVFSPSHLVVRHGGKTSATCTVCQQKCLNERFGVESALGTLSTNGTIIKWTVDKMTEWDSSPLCFYGSGSGQCFTSLLITVYQPPAKVSLSFVNHSGPLILGRNYTMQCLVEDVAPVRGLTVVFYKGQTQLAQFKLDGRQKKPVTKTVLFEYRPGREYHNWNYYCEAILQLGTERHSWWNEEEVNVDTYFPPQLDVPPFPPFPPKVVVVVVIEGDTLALNCLAYGNPEPSYRWTLPSGQTTTGSSVFTLESFSDSDEGHYTCFASNYLGNDTMDYTVYIQRVTTITTTAMTTTTTKTTTTTTTAKTTQKVLNTTAIIGTTSSTSSTSSTSRTTSHRFILGFMLLFLALV